MRTRNVVSKILLGSIPLIASVSAFAQGRYPAPPPPPVFPSGSEASSASEPPAVSESADAPPQQAPRAAYSQQDTSRFPSQLTVKRGTWLPIRMEQQLSSDRNQSGENFYATLADPIVVNGVVIAHRGQAVVGRITEAHKAGRVEGVSKLGLEILGITLADGENMSVHTRILQHSGPTSVGRDLGTVGQATAMGAAIGGVSEGGKGAGIGAGVGAAAGLAGVLFTRGKATVVYPETLLTFELESAVEVDTTRSGAFRYADSRDYERDRNYSTRRTNPQQPPPPYYGGYGPGGYGPGWGYGYPYGGYRGGVGIIIGRGYRGRYGRR